MSLSSTSISQPPQNTRTPLDAVGGPGGLAVVVITVVFVVGLITTITTVTLILKALQTSEFEKNYDYNLFILLLLFFCRLNSIMKVRYQFLLYWVTLKHNFIPA